MIEINTFIAKCYETDFPEIEQLTSSKYFNIKDSAEFNKCKKNFEIGNTIYTSGYIEIVYLGQTYIGKKYWDYVIWLWREILACIDELIFNNKDIEVLFPGQSLYFFIKQNKGNLLVGIKESNHIHEQIIFPRKEFLIPFIRNGLDVFCLLQEVKQANSNILMINNCKKYLAKLSDSAPGSF